MPEPRVPTIAIVDYGMGNLFSVKRACEQAQLPAVITNAREDILAASAVILPGVGAFGDAMDTLRALDLASVMRDVAAAGVPLVGICLGMQLLMTESHEFGYHKGLGLVEGDVVRFDDRLGAKLVKVPHIGWSRIHAPAGAADADGSWTGTLLSGLPDGEFMYFVHSFYCRPQDPRLVLSTSRYGANEFAANVRVGSVFGCQYHPERSGLQGLRLYQNLAATINVDVSEGAPYR